MRYITTQQTELLTCAVDCMRYMRFNGGMDTTIRNLDAWLYRRLRALAAAEGRPVGVMLNLIISDYLARRPLRRDGKRGTILDFPVFDLGPGSENLSEHVDEFL